MAEDGTTDADSAAITSVAAHGMLNSLGVARATIATLRLHWAQLDEETCVRLLGRAEEQLTFLGETLSDIVRGIPSDTRAYLDTLREGRE
jgi:hypothetical protein